MSFNVTYRSNGLTSSSFPNEKSLSDYIKSQQPPKKRRAGKSGRLVLGGWFWNQRQRSRLIFRDGYIWARVDKV